LSSTRRRTSRSWFEMINKTEEEDKTSVEAHAYTPGLKVKRSMTVDKTRRLPIFGEVLVDAGGKVEHDTIVARTEISGDPEIVKVAMKLGVEAEDLHRYMKVKIGDAVEEGGQMAYYSALRADQEGGGIPDSRDHRDDIRDNRPGHRQGQAGAR
jgi:hypothetical protein